MIITINYDENGNATGASIDRYNPHHKHSRDYEKVTSASMKRLNNIIEAYGSYSTKCAPGGRHFWTRHTCIIDPVRRRHFSELNRHHNGERIEINKRWEINQEIYDEFLNILPPLRFGRGWFIHREFNTIRITTKYTIEHGKYFCQWYEEGLKGSVRGKMVAERIKDFSEEEIERTLGNTGSRKHCIRAAREMIEDEGLTIEELYAEFGRSPSDE